MEKVFEYKIEVDATEVDSAKGSIEDLGKSTEKTTSKIAADINKDIKSVGDAAKSTSGAFTKIGTAGKTAFTSLGKGLKGLTGATEGLGTALKANPLFTLVAVITPILYLLKDFLDQLGLLTIVTDALSAAFDFLISMLKNLTDWLGITDHAGKERGKNAAAASEEAYNELVKEQAALEKLDAAYRKTEDAHIEYMRALEETGDETALDKAKKSLEQLQEDYIRDTEIQTEQINKLRDLRLSADIAAADARKVLDAAIKSGNEEEIQEAQDKYDKLKEVYFGYINDIEVAKEQLKTNEIKFNTAVIKANQNVTREEKNELAKQEANNKAYYEARRSARQTLKDLEINAIEDDTLRELAKNQERYDRLIEQTKTDEKLLGDEKNAIIASLEEERLAKEKEIRDKAQELQDQKTKEEEQKKIADELRLQELDLELQKMRFAALDAAELKNNNLSLENKLQLIRDSYVAEQELLDQQKQLDLDKLEIERENELISEEEFLAKKALLEQKYANESAKLIDAKEDKEESAKNYSISLAQQEKDAKIKAAVDVTNALGSLLEEGSAAAKAFAVAQALYQTYLGIQAAFTSTSTVPGAALTGANFAAAAAAAIFGFANVANILATDSKNPSPGGSAGGSAGGAPSTNASAISIPNSNIPNFFGVANETGGGFEQFDVKESDRPEPIRAIVSWTDIDAVSNSDRNIRQEMQL